jgi:hypothetical protein
VPARLAVAEAMRLLTDVRLLIRVEVREGERVISVVVRWDSAFMVYNPLIFLPPPTCGVQWLCRLFIFSARGRI